MKYFKTYNIFYKIVNVPCEMRGKTCSFIIANNVFQMLPKKFAILQ